VVPKLHAEVYAAISLASNFALFRAVATTEDSRFTKAGT